MLPVNAIVLVTFLSSALLVAGNTDADDFIEDVINTYNELDPKFIAKMADKTIDMSRKILLVKTYHVVKLTDGTISGFGKITGPASAAQYQCADGAEELSSSFSMTLNGKSKAFAQYSLLKNSGTLQTSDVKVDIKITIRHDLMHNDPGKIELTVGMSTPYQVHAHGFGLWVRTKAAAEKGFREQFEATVTETIRGTVLAGLKKAVEIVKTN